MTPPQTETCHKAKKRKKRQTPKIKLANDGLSDSEECQIIDKNDNESHVKMNINNNQESVSEIPHENSFTIPKEWRTTSPSNHPQALPALPFNMSLNLFWHILKPLAHKVISDNNIVHETKILRELSKELECPCTELWRAFKESVISKIRLLTCYEDMDANKLSVHEWLVFDMVLVHQNHDIIDMAETIQVDKNIFIELFALVEKFDIESLEGDELAEAWSAVTMTYNTKGRQATPMLLQCRWYQLKLATRNRFLKYSEINKDNPDNKVAAEIYKPTGLQVSIANRFPSLLTKPFPIWQELIKQKRVILREQFQLIALRKRAQSAENNLHPQIYNNNTAVIIISSVINSDVEANIIDKYASKPIQMVLPQITNVFGNVTDETLSKINTLSEIKNDKNNHNIEVVSDVTTSNTIIPNKLQSNVSKNLIKDDNWSAYDVISHQNLPQPTNVKNISLTYDSGNENVKKYPRAKRKSSLKNKKSKSNITADVSSKSIKDVGTSIDNVSNRTLTDIEFVNCDVTLNESNVLAGKPNWKEDHGSQLVSEESRIEIHKIKSEEKNKNKLDRNQPNACDGKPTYKSLKRLKLSSDLFQKPRNLVYDSAKLINNPDFNRKLKKLKRFSKSFKNKELLAVLKPLTVDVSNEFESALVDGTIYLDTSDDKNHEENNLTVKSKNIPKDDINETNLHKDAHTSKNKTDDKQISKLNPHEDITNERCCWVRDKIFRLENKLGGTTHRCPYPKCLCCCKEKYLHILNKNIRPGVETDINFTITSHVDNNVITNSSQSEVFTSYRDLPYPTDVNIFSDNVKELQENSNLIANNLNRLKDEIPNVQNLQVEEYNKSTQTDIKPNVKLLNIEHEPNYINSNEDIVQNNMHIESLSAKYNMDIDIEEEINKSVIRKCKKLLLPKIISVHGDFRETNETSDINVLQTQINSNSNLSEVNRNISGNETSLVTDDVQNINFSYLKGTTANNNIRNKPKTIENSTSTDLNDIIKNCLEDLFGETDKFKIESDISDNNLSQVKEFSNTLPTNETISIKLEDSDIVNLTDDNNIHYITDKNDNTNSNMEQNTDSKDKCNIKIKMSSHLLQKPNHRTYNVTKLIKNPDFNKELRNYPEYLYNYYKNRLNLKPVTIDVSKEFETALVNGKMCLDTDNNYEDINNQSMLFMALTKDNQKPNPLKDTNTENHSNKKTNYKKKFKDKTSTNDVLNECCWARKKMYRLEKGLSDDIENKCPCPSCLCCCRRIYANYIANKIVNSVTANSTLDSIVGINNSNRIGRDAAKKDNNFNSDLSEITKSCDDLNLKTDNDINYSLSNIKTEIVTDDNTNKTSKTFSNNYISGKSIIIMTTANIPTNLNQSDMKLFLKKLKGKVKIARRFDARLTSYEVNEKNNMNNDFNRLKIKKLLRGWTFTTNVKSYSSVYIYRQFLELPVYSERLQPLSNIYIDNVIGELLKTVLKPLTSVSELFYAYLLNGLFFILDLDNDSIYPVNICFKG